MPEFAEALRQRRSIRKFKPQPVAPETIKTLLETASFAPSAHNNQPWGFIVLTETAQKTTLGNAMAQVWLAELERDHVPENTRWAKVNRSVERFIAAPALIVACFKLEEAEKHPDIERRDIERDMAVQSLAAAIQTLLMAAHFNGLGACWLCAPLFCKATVRQALKIPDGVEPQALIMLGYPDEAPKTPPRNPVEEYSYLNCWGNPL
jgi:coenzyme F420-0:L-glutamate ligase / coenzyme F420-1:gamma-L-glutamate ligase